MAAAPVWLRSARCRRPQQWRATYETAPILDQRGPPGAPIGGGRSALPAQSSRGLKVGYPWGTRAWQLRDNAGVDTGVPSNAGSLARLNVAGRTRSRPERGP